MVTALDPMRLDFILTAAREIYAQRQCPPDVSESSGSSLHFTYDIPEQGK
jgi:hypothetical protein